ncbi:MAG: RluA family pseudouridine synthase [Ruminococcaceae bacterium]|nr:RluA family pseudouridine synthase [Oscillospiraceae bacterium]
MIQENEYIIVDDVVGLRLDKAVTVLCEAISRNAVQQLIDDGNILVNGVAVNKKYSVKKNDVVTVLLPELKELSIEAENIPLDIVYEDEHLLVVNKPKGMVVHPAAGNYNGTLVNALLYHCGSSLSGINGVIRPGIVHRIDKDTSGLLIVAKNDTAHKGLAEQIKDHSFTREYKTVVVGNVKDNEGTIDAPIGRHPKDRKKQAVTDKNSRNAVSHFEVIERYNGFTFLKVRLETGRTHQIRVHMAYRGTPVAGDVVYGNPKKTYGLQGQCLHAATIGFIHPVTKEYLEFTSDLPDYFTDFIRRIS